MGPAWCAALPLLVVAAPLTLIACFRSVGLGHGGEPDSGDQEDADADGPDAQGDADGDDADPDEELDGEWDTDHPPCDEDRDLHVARECGGDDCDDQDAAVHPGAIELCGNAADDDCDGRTDPAWGVAGGHHRVTNDPSWTGYEVLAWTGSAIGVAWDDQRDGNDEIYFTLLDPDGTSLTPETRITNESEASWIPAMAWTGTEFVIAWYDHRGGSYGIWLARIGATGAEIGDEVRVSTDAVGAARPSIVWTGSELAVAWQDERHGLPEIYLARLDEQGARIGTDHRVSNDAGWSEWPSLAWTGSELVLAWMDDRDGNNEIYLARLAPDGSPIGGEIRLTSDSARSEEPHIVWSGSELGVAWTDGRDGSQEVYFQRVSAAGVPVGTPLRVSDLLASTSADVSLVWDGAQYVAAWSDTREAENRVFVARISASGELLGGNVPVTDPGSLGGWATLVDLGGDIGVGWTDDRDGNYEIYFAHLDGCR